MYRTLLTLHIKETSKYLGYVLCVVSMYMDSSFSVYTASILLFVWIVWRLVWTVRIHRRWAAKYPQVTIRNDMSSTFAYREWIQTLWMLCAVAGRGKLRITHFCSNHFFQLTLKPRVQIQHVSRRRLGGVGGHTLGVLSSVTTRSVARYHDTSICGSKVWL